jgi:hypothetical protein
MIKAWWTRCGGETTNPYKFLERNLNGASGRSRMDERTILEWI